MKRTVSAVLALVFVFFLSWPTYALAESTERSVYDVWDSIAESEVRSEVMGSADSENETKISVVSVILSAVLVLIGVFFLVKPETAWKLQTFLSVKNGEPTDFYIISTRIAGVVWIAAGVVWFVVDLTMI